jgi:hypothetical protein
MSEPIISLFSEPHYQGEYHQIYDQGVSRFGVFTTGSIRIRKGFAAVIVKSNETRLSCAQEMEEFSEGPVEATGVDVEKRNIGQELTTSFNIRLNQADEVFQIVNPILK